MHITFTPNVYDIFGKFTDKTLFFFKSKTFNFHTSFTKMKSNRDRERQQVPRSKIPYDCRVENRLTFRIRPPHTTTRAENGVNRTREGGEVRGEVCFERGGPENGVNRRR